MNTYLFLFHSTLGAVRMRRALQAAQMTFRIADLPRTLRGGCGLAIWLICRTGEEQRWVISGETEAIYLCQGEEYQLIRCFPARSP